MQEAVNCMSIRKGWSKKWFMVKKVASVVEKIGKWKMCMSLLTENKVRSIYFNCRVFVLVNKYDYKSILSIKSLQRTAFQNHHSCAWAGSSSSSSVENLVKKISELRIDIRIWN